MAIKAPFNFVPLSDKVFFPDWADKISQDVPFEDGVSGTIELKITAQTPIFVRNGHKKSDADAKNDEYKSFSKTEDNQYFIPATSIKGAIRNVLEIVSFGKMTQVDNQSFGKRDLDDSSYTSLMRNVKCGWLYLDNNGGYEIENHGKPQRVSIKDVDKALNKGNILYKFITETDFKSENEKDKLARKKYEIIFRAINKGVDLSSKEGYEVFLNSNDYLLKSNDGGTYVLTGQSSRRYHDPQAKKPKVGKDGQEIGCSKGKEKEFLFPSDVKGTIPVNDDTFKTFETIHKDSEDYFSFWKKKLHKGHRIPVFFIIENNELQSIGLTGLYKYPYKRNVFDAIPSEMKNPNKDKADDFRMDLAECIFGYIFDKNALRGRVHFGHAYAIGKQTPMAQKNFVSGSPHPSFYPLYVKNGWNWDMANSIAGRKRYPIKKQANYNNSGTKNMEQICSMLSAGTSFREKITFHNLKPVELGALLSAITLHKNQDKCYHNIGFGKPYGYGSVKISNMELNFVDNSKDYYMLKFEKEMEKQVPGWKESSSIKELINMAQGIPVGCEKYFQYLTMSNNKDDNEFLHVKKSGEHLSAFSIIVGREGVVPSISEKFVSFEDEIKEKQKEEEENRQKELKIADEQKKREERLKSLDFGFLENETRFKTGWDRLKKKLQEIGKDWNHEVYSQLSIDNQSLIESFCKRMFSRKDSKWGSKNRDYARQYAVTEVIRVVGKEITKLS